MANYVFLGAPGAGKGTMAGMLQQHFGISHVSTGDSLRAEMARGSRLGAMARECVDSGRLVPDAVVADIVAAKLVEPELQQHGFVLDGYPRTTQQAELLDTALARNKLALTAVVLFEVDEDLLLRRLTARRLCRDCQAGFNLLFSPPQVEDICDACGGALVQRADDNETTVRDRLRVYECQTMPLIEHYAGRGLLIRVTGSREKEANFAVLCESLNLKP